MLYETNIYYNGKYPNIYIDALIDSNYPKKGLLALPRNIDAAISEFVIIVKMLTKNRYPSNVHKKQINNVATNIQPITIYDIF